MAPRAPSWRGSRDRAPDSCGPPSPGRSSGGNATIIGPNPRAGQPRSRARRPTRSPRSGREASPPSGAGVHASRGTHVAPMRAQPLRKVRRPAILAPASPAARDRGTRCGRGNRAVAYTAAGGASAPPRRAGSAAPGRRSTKAVKRRGELQTATVGRRERNFRAPTQDPASDGHGCPGSAPVGRVQQPARSGQHPGVLR